MELSIKIGISNRHVHLSQTTYAKLFDEPMNIDRELSQTGEFASDKRVTISANGKEFTNVRILGPCRNYDQVEISHYDAFILGLNPPVRASGDLSGAEPITISTEKASITVDACILAQRHVHMSTRQAEELGIKNGQKLALKISGERSGTLDVYAKIADNGVLEAHLDMDDANAFMVKTGDEALLEI